MRLFGSALIPDFQHYYNLRFTQVVEEWEPWEVLSLIAGLPEDSLYIGRMTGEKNRGWRDLDYLMLDMRNILEAIRMQTASGKRKGKFREWNHYPGRESMKKKKIQGTIRSLMSLAKRGGEIT